jgi:bifunctional NMN adenylyltransferase/nudix hydrolase
MNTLAVVIGRFQPVHLFHVQTLIGRARSYDATILLLGSSSKARDEKNPLRWEERRDLILAGVGDEWGEDLDTSFLHFHPIKDYPYSNNRWVFQIQRGVEERLAELERETGEAWEPVLVGVDKDDSTYYLRLFPQWKHDIFRPPASTLKFSATTIRAAMFEDRWTEVGELTGPTVEAWLREWMAGDEGRRIQAEYQAAQHNRLVLAYERDGVLVKAPYPPIFHTTDSVVLWRGHVLLIERRAEPGKGLWALPGGHLQPDEWIRAGAVRERQEESRIRFFHKGARRRLRLHADWCRASHTFDYPGRSLRGRTITEGFLWVIPDEYEVEIMAASDAARAVWFPLYQVLHQMDYELFEDHQSIIAHFALGMMH